MTRTVAALCLVLSAGLAACGGGDDGKGPDASGTDGGALIDGATGVDATQACENSTECTNPDFAVCDTSAGRCVQCLTTGDCEDYFFSHVCDTGTNMCVECLEQADCDGDPTALGPTCDVDNGYCKCAGSDECADNPNGAVCDADYDACTCLTDDDCEAPLTCQDSFYLGDGEKKTCQMPM